MINMNKILEIIANNVEPRKTDTDGEIKRDTDGKSLYVGCSYLLTRSLSILHLSTHRICDGGSNSNFTGSTEPQTKKTQSHFVCMQDDMVGNKLDGSQINVKVWMRCTHKKKANRNNRTRKNLCMSPPPRHAVFFFSQCNRNNNKIIAHII